MNKTLHNKLKTLNVAIVSHIFATGPALELEEFLKDKVKSLFFIGHPFSYRAEINSFSRLWVSGKLKEDKKAFGWRLPDVFLYFKDAFYTFFWILNSRRKIDLYIGSDNFDAFLGLLLKKLGKVDDVILYTIDYIPERFPNPILNWLYHFFDKQCLTHCKVVWNVSLVMAEAREKYKGLEIKKHVPQIIAPLGMWYKRIPKTSFSKRERFQLVFMGHILEKQGLDVVIESMPLILKKLPKARLVIMGTGNHEDNLKNLAKKLKIDEHVAFTGYVDRHEDIEHELSRSMVAVAMYKSDPKSFTQWADPGKLKNYLAAGLPIILTSVPPVAKELEVKKCAVISEYNARDFSQKTIRLLSNAETLIKYSSNAIAHAARFDWDIVFSNALSKSL